MKRAFLFSITIASIAALAPSARADENHGIAVGARVGYGAPMGSAQDGLTMGDLEGGMLALTFDLGYRFNPHWYVGGILTWGVTQPTSVACGPGATCNGSDLQLGLNVHYHVWPDSKFDPWVGLGFGYESTHVNTSLVGGDSESYELHGIQFLNLQVGGDLRFVEQVPFGPYVGFSLGQFANGTLTTPNGTENNLVFDSAMHEWLTVGVRGQFQL